MKSKNMTLMAIAIGCGLVAAFLTARLSGGSAPETVDVVVAKKELPVGTMLEEKDLESLLAQAKFNKASLPPDVITNVAELKGKRVNRTMRVGNYFSPGDVGEDAGIRIPDGMFKYAIKMDGVKAAAGFVEPGKHVDVILTESLPNGKAKSGVILRDVLVLAVDTQARMQEGAAGGRQTVNSVSVAVSPKHALILSSAEKRGEVKLMLRDDKNPDHTKVEAQVKIEGFDEDSKEQGPAAPVGKSVSVVFAKADVPLNTFVTKDNFDVFFEVREVPEELVAGVAKVIKDPATLREKYITRKLEAEQMVFNTWLGETKVEPEVVFKEKIVEVPASTFVGPVQEKKELPAVAKAAEPEPLFVQPREKEVEKPLYPRKFVQIINNHQVWFMEIAPGEFRRVDGNGKELKDLPDTGTIEKKQERKPDEARNDRAA
jgi:pilus assembly protein CpaB